MKISNGAKQQLKEFEGCRLKAYLCAAGVATIGYGHTGNVSINSTITQAEADSLLDKDLQRFEVEINRLKGINQYQFDALVSFVFNVGMSNFNRSTLKRKLIINPNDPTIPQEFLKWKYAGGRVLKGLERRRKWESEWYKKK